MLGKTQRRAQHGFGAVRHLGVDRDGEPGGWIEAGKNPARLDRMAAALVEAEPRRDAVGRAGEGAVDIAVVDGVPRHEVAGTIEPRPWRAGIEPVARAFFASASVQSRLEGVGVVPREACGPLGFVGPVARACEVARDVRQDHPWGVYRFAHIPAATAWAGDVFARAHVRWLEVRRSLPFLLEQAAAVPRGALAAPMGALHPDELSVALVEGWRGEIVHAVVTDARGRIRRYKVTDPSFRNWDALALAMPGNQISDFPLCNKSFNLSYAGHDL